ncbi:aminoglycoside phosphotransferase family protein [Streptomyces sp. NPDC059837]|uniref:aminoglycoside phosphotransferase family protein n=1 Tax=Streptomyces sp. NPDC059837 TaxID=3346968 RepID=UPI00365FDFE6
MTDSRTLLDSKTPPDSDTLPGSKTLSAAVHAWAEGVLGPLTVVRDASHPRPGSQVWEVTHRGDGARHFVKISPTPKFFARETRAYRQTAPALGRGSVPRLVESNPQQQALLLTAVPGRGVKSLPLSAARQRAVHRQAGAWLSRFHGGPRDLSPRDHAEAAAETARAIHSAEKHLERARDLIGARDRETVRRHAAELTRLGPLPHGYVHGDFQERNWLLDTGPGRLAVVDLERARPHAVVFDMVLLACGPWVGRPDLRAAFFEGYGRELTDKEERSLRCLSALDAASAISWGVPHHDPEIVERGRATLARLERGDPG